MRRAGCAWTARPDAGRTHGFAPVGRDFQQYPVPDTEYLYLVRRTGRAFACGGSRGSDSLGSRGSDSLRKAPMQGAFFKGSDPNCPDPNCHAAAGHAPNSAYRVPVPGTRYPVRHAIPEYSRQPLARPASVFRPHPAHAFRIPHAASPHHLAAGSVTVNVDPLPSVLRTVMSPPIARARSRLIARPSPTPSSLVIPPPTCTNGSNTRSM